MDENQLPSGLGFHMSERDRALVKEIAEQVSQTTVARFFDAMEDENRIQQIADKWSGYAQKVVGRAVIRTVVMIVVGAAAITALKAGLIEWLMSLAQSGGHK